MSTTVNASAQAMALAASLFNKESGSWKKLFITGIVSTLLLMTGAVCAEEQNDDLDNVSSTALVNSASSPTPRSSIKDQGKVYRDPYGNRITAPASKDEAKDAEEDFDALNPSSFPDSHTDEQVKSDVDNQSSSSLQSSLEQVDEGLASSVADSNELSATQDNAGKTTTLPANPKIAVIYFTQPELISGVDHDAMTGASLVYDRDNHRTGTTKYLADLIASYTKADLFRINKTASYPREHEDLIYEASVELDNQTHPEIQLKPSLNINKYDVIFLGYPIWWYDLPMPIYSFFDEFDLSGKIVIPFCTHGGSRPYKTFANVANGEPNAKVLINNGLVLDRYQVGLQGKKIIESWLNSLNRDTFNGMLLPKEELKSAP